MKLILIIVTFLLSNLAHGQTLTIVNLRNSTTKVLISIVRPGGLENREYVLFSADEIKMEVGMNDVYIDVQIVKHLPESGKSINAKLAERTTIKGKTLIIYRKDEFKTGSEVLYLVSELSKT